MIDRKKPIIDARKTVVGEQSVNAYNLKNVPEAAAEATAPVQNTPTPQPVARIQNPKTSQDWDDYMAYTAKSYDELIPQVEEQMNAFKPLTKAQLEKIRKRQRARSVMSGITDAVRSVANLVATHNYAPDMYDATNGMSARAKARFEKDKAEREAKDAEYYQLAMKLGHLKQQKAAALAGLAAQKHQQELADKEAQRKQEEHDDKRALNSAKESKLDAETERALAQANLTNEQLDFLKKYGYLPGKPPTSRGGSRSGGGGTVWWARDENGRYYPITAKSEAQAHNQAGRMGWTIDTYTTTSTKNEGGTTRSRQTTPSGGNARKGSPTKGKKKSPTA